MHLRLLTHAYSTNRPFIIVVVVIIIIVLIVLIVIVMLILTSLPVARLKVLSSERTLHTAKALRTRLSQRHTSTPHIADLGRSTSIARTVWTLDRHLTLVGVELANDAVVPLHSFRDLVPESGVQRSVGWPACLSTIGLTGAVLDLVGWAVAGQVGEAVDIGVESIGIVDLEVSGVDLVHSVARVEIGQWRDGWADPGIGEGIAGRLLSSIVRVENLDLYGSGNAPGRSCALFRTYLIFVGVAKEDVGNDVRAVAVHNLVEQIGRVWQWVGTVPSRKHVCNNPDSLAYNLSAL